MNKLLKSKQELNTRNKKEYKIEIFYNKKYYIKEFMDWLPGLYFLISWKSYSENETISVHVSTEIYIFKIISIFYKNYIKKPISMFLFIGFALFLGK